MLTGKDVDGNAIEFSEANIDKAEDGQTMSTSGTILSWISGSTPTYIKSVPDGTYTLHEEAAPNGYTKTTDIIFVVENGKVIEINGEEIEATSSVIMTDELSEITVNKYDIT